MFFTVRYGAGEQQIFNPDCSLELLVESIQKKCHCPAEYEVALVDEKKSILNLSDEKPVSCCCSLFINRGTYVLVAVDRREDLTPKYIPLLDNIEPDLAMKLDVLSNPDQKPVRARINRGSKTNILPLAAASTATYGKRKQSVCPSTLAARNKPKKA